MSGDEVAYEFQADRHVEELIHAIVREMVSIFDVAEREAVVRINARFRGQVLNQDHIIFHEEAGFWARDIMYGPESLWWKSETEAARLPFPE